MSLAVTELIVGVMFLTYLGVWIWGLVDSLSKPDAVWRAAGQSKVLWVLIVVVLGFIGALVYLIVARPQLQRASSP